MKLWKEDTSKLDTEYGTVNWAYNGSFEMQPVDSPFDWHFHENDAVQVDRDTENAYKGNTSLRLKFNGNPKDTSAIAYQTVILKPGTWQLKAAMRTLILSGDQGIVIRAYDLENPSRLDVSTNTFTHTQEWTTISKTFKVTSLSHVLRLEIERLKTLETGIRLTGTAWLDAVSLNQVE